VRLGALQRGHRNRIREILDATSVFRDEEVQVALELFDETFAAGPARAPYDPGDGVANYEFVGSFSREGQLVGYVCYGATPGTDRTYDLYWIAMHPAFQGEGGGSQLLDEVERRLRQREDVGFWLFMVRCALGVTRRGHSCRAYENGLRFSRLWPAVPPP